MRPASGLRKCSYFRPIIWWTTLLFLSRFVPRSLSSRLKSRDIMTASSAASMSFFCQSCFQLDVSLCNGLFLNNGCVLNALRHSVMHFSCIRIQNIVIIIDGLDKRISQSFLRKRLISSTTHLLDPQPSPHLSPTPQAVCSVG